LHAFSNKSLECFNDKNQCNSLPSVEQLCGFFFFFLYLLIHLLSTSISPSQFTLAATSQLYALIKTKKPNPIKTNVQNASLAIQKHTAKKAHLKF